MGKKGKKAAGVPKGYLLLERQEIFK